MLVVSGVRATTFSEEISDIFKPGICLTAVTHCSLQSFHEGSVGKESACSVGDKSSILGSERYPKKEMTTHSSILAWEIPRTEEAGGLQSWGRKESYTT